MKTPDGRLKHECPECGHSLEAGYRFSIYIPKQLWDRCAVLYPGISRSSIVRHALSMLIKL